MSDVTQLFSQIDAGDPKAAEQLLPLVYDELRKLAAARLAQEKPGQTLQATALVHEAYLRLLGPDHRVEPGTAIGCTPRESGPTDADLTFNSRGHFFAAAAEAMRRILVDNARRKLRPKLGGDRRRVGLDEACLVSDERADELLALHAALEKLEAEDPPKARLVKLRYFAGLSH